MVSNFKYESDNYDLLCKMLDLRKLTDAILITTQVEIWSIQKQSDNLEELSPLKYVPLYHIYYYDQDFPIEQGLTRCLNVF